MMKLFPRGWKIKFVKLVCLTMILVVCVRIYKAIFRRTEKDIVNVGLAGKVLQRNEKGWNVVNDKACLMKYDFVLGHLKLPNRTPIFVYSEKVDLGISRDIIKYGSYEDYNLDKIVSLLKQNPDAVFLDIGANVGPFTLPVAAYGYRVVAIEHHPSHVMRMCASMSRANLDDKLTIVRNSLGDHRREGIENSDIEDRVESLDTILLDDVLDILNFKHVIMRLSVGRFEYDILKGSTRFFYQVNVEAVLIAFYLHKHKERAKFIIDFLAFYGLEPDVPTNIKDFPSKWEDKDILFMRKRPN